MSVRNADPKTLTSRSATVTARNVGGGPGLVDEDQALGVEIELPFEPGLALLRDVGAAVARKRARSFFARDRVTSEEALDRAEAEAEPVCGKRAAHPSMVASPSGPGPKNGFAAGFDALRPAVAAKRLGTRVEKMLHGVDDIAEPRRLPARHRNPVPGPPPERAGDIRRNPPPIKISGLGRHALAVDKAAVKRPRARSDMIAQEL